MTARVKVWDPLVRVFHWGLVLSFATAWLSAGHFKTLHFWAGYTAAGLLVVRILWGLFGTRYARFSHFVRSPGAVLAYIRDIARGHEQRHLGHNPAGGAMIVALILTLLTQVTTGLMMTSDAFFGVEWVEVTHFVMSRLLLGLVALHILGVAVASLRHRENLPLAMLTGHKREAEAGDVA